MAISYTTKLGQSKPDDGEQDWGVQWRQDADRLEARLATSFAGDPNGEVAGYWVGQKCWDTVGNELYFCVTATGTVETSVWTPFLPKVEGDPNGEIAGWWVGQLALDTEEGVLYLCTLVGDASTAEWEPYGGGSDKVDKTGDTMTGPLSIDTATANLQLLVGDGASTRVPFLIQREGEASSLWRAELAANGDLDLVRGPGAAGTERFLINGGLPWAGTVAQTLSATGYQRMPSGLVLQWGGQTGITAKGTRDVTFPLTFPSAALHVFTQFRNTTFTGSDSVVVGIGNLNTAGFRIYNNADMAVTLSWLAVGY